MQNQYTVSKVFTITGNSTVLDRAVIASRLIHLPKAAVFRVGTINVDVVVEALAVVSIQIVFVPTTATVTECLNAAIAAHARVRGFNITDVKALFGEVHILDETAARFQYNLIRLPSSLPAVVVSVTVAPAALSFLSTGDAAAATAFVNSFVANAAALANVSSDAVSIAFRINDRPPIPASTFMGGGAGRRRLQQLNTLNSVVVVATVLVITSPSANATAAVQATFNSLASNATAISAALGVQVLSLATVVQTIWLYPPPPLPLPPPDPPPHPQPLHPPNLLFSQRPESAQDEGMGLDSVVYVLLAVGGVGVGLLGAFGYPIALRLRDGRWHLGMLESISPQAAPQVVHAQPLPPSQSKGHVGIRRAWEADSDSIRSCDSTVSTASTAFSSPTLTRHTATTRIAKVVPV